MSQRAACHVLHALICLMSFCTYIKNMMKTHRVCKEVIDACLVGAGLQPHFWVPPACVWVCQRQPVLVWLLSSQRYHLQLFVLCLLVIVYWNNAIIPSASCCAFPNGLLRFLVLIISSLNFRIGDSLCSSRITWAQNTSLLASRSEGRMWNLSVPGGGREGKFRIMCRTIKMLLTGNLKQWRVLLFLQIHELKTAANDGKC